MYDSSTTHIQILLSLHLNEKESTLDKWRRHELLAFILSIPRHLINKKSWHRLFTEPIRCGSYFMSPFLYTFSQRNQRSVETALSTTLTRLIDFVGSKADSVPVHVWPLETEFSKFQDESEVNKLNLLFTTCGSDKTIHGYGKIYQIIIASIHARNLGSTSTIVEIGIGSRNPRIPSNMGVFGTPGASLRAFRAFSDTVVVVGGDVDQAALFQEERITTFHVDQLSQDSLNQFLTKSGSYDLFIDDGLHELDANLNTLKAALAHGKLGSWIVIEDIDQEKSAEWLAVAKLLSEQYQCWLVKAHHSLLFVVFRDF